MIKSSNTTYYYASIKGTDGNTYVAYKTHMNRFSWRSTAPYEASSKDEAYQVAERALSECAKASWEDLIAESVRIHRVNVEITDTELKD